ncbi:hypothetical protein RRG08_064245 [Elysia crispata]|uniref:Uncharacterized protein n=1 Tax=Elysia crispata TaxID=231223 RepID=A0AAE0YDM7_9GAST|nr:hypothetical protein RRG08_064245 [Elysia crispata]
MFACECSSLSVRGTQGQGVEWLLRPETTSAREGDNVTFTCRLNVDDPNIIWVKNVEGQSSTIILFVKGSRFEADDRLYVINRYDLVITDVRREDNGQYACRTKDAGIQTATLTVLLFPGQPTISRSPRGPVYTEKDDVTFTCSSTGGNPNPTITWLKNGNISTAVQQVTEAATVGGTTSSAIRVKLDKTDHQANYSCLVSNELNFNSPLVGSTLVSVLYSPSIAFRPYSPVYAVRLGDPAEVTCDVDSNPQVSSVRWSKDGVNLSGTNPWRRLSPASKADSGEYTCTATNSIGEKSGKLRVDVQYAPVVNTNPSVVVTEGDDVTVTCQVDSNPAPYEVQWSRERASGSSQTLVTNATLTLRSVTRDQAGNYSCWAQNQLKLSGKREEFRDGRAFSFLYVQYQPGPASIAPVPDVDVGERLDITCSAKPRGYPEAIYRWTKDGQTLSETRQTLTIASVSLLDNGRYSCTPSNSQGSGQPAFVEVNVFEPPMILDPPIPEVTVFLTDPRLLTLTCEAQGYPQPQVTWYRKGDNKPLNSLTELFTVAVTTKLVDDYSVKVESSLQFKGLKREVSADSGSNDGTQLLIDDMGNYSCQAESEKHSEVPVAFSNVLINFPPVLRASPARLAVSPRDRAVFRCAAQAHPDPGFRWFFRGRQLSSGTQTLIAMEQVQGTVGGFESRLTLSQVTDRSYGQYSCLVVNALGNTTKNIQLSRKSTPEQPGDLKAVTVTWESAHLRWLPGFDGGFTQDFYIQKSGGAEEPKRVKVTPSSAISFNVTKLRPSATYTFQVVPENDLGFGRASSPITVTTNGKTELSRFMF